MKMGLTYRRLFARYYDRVMAKTEVLCLANWRRDLLAGISGEVLEIGAGTGLNLACYPETVSRLVLSEPDGFMRDKLQEKITGGQPNTEVTACSAEHLNFPDHSFDAVVSTLVLCSVDHLDAALKEIRRVLRPGGQLFFLEHVHTDHPGINFWQCTLEPLWKRACGNCHLTRKTGEGISAAGFELDEVADLRMTGAPVFVRRVLLGVARKPSKG